VRDAVMESSATSSEEIKPNIADSKFWLPLLSFRLASAKFEVHRNQSISITEREEPNEREKA
jgi:hypothetical protein